MKNVRIKHSACYLIGALSLQIYFEGPGAFEKELRALHVNPNKYRLSPNKCSLSPNNVPRFCIKTVFWPLCNHFKPDFDRVVLGG
jgi:hypothetical protein